MVLAGSQEYVTTLLIRRFGQSWPEIPKHGRNAAGKRSMEREQGKIAHPLPRVRYEPAVVRQGLNHYRPRGSRLVVSPFREK
ncbi:hypothetical protein ASZ90_015421 [hydrocarbon metagenome]|uniref:Uncharacterized protein n=1 Tax=hydrocarbon metagenome TaxID=938273 RepID=A0A0W8F200_9ZZZZ